jgi:hypothetical protein
MTARPMTRWPARRLIVGLAALTALFDLAVLLPGNPYSSRDEFVGAVVIQTLVLWGLWRGSAVAWVVATAFAVLTFLSWVLMQPSLGRKVRFAAGSRQPRYRRAT